MSSVYCDYLSFSDAVAPIGAASHNVGEGRFLLVSTSRICAFFANVIAGTVGPAALQGARGRRLGTSTAPTGAAAVVASMTWSVHEL